MGWLITAYSLVWVERSATSSCVQPSRQILRRSVLARCLRSQAATFARRRTLSIDRLVHDVTKRALAEIAVAGPALDELAGHLRGVVVDPDWYRELGAGLTWLGDLLELFQ